jgi:polar amino acid transport system permease protein
MRLSTQPLIRRLASVYVGLFRNIPALVLIIFLAFALPNLVPVEMRQRLFFDNGVARWGQYLTGLSLPYYMLAAIVALTLNTSAYLAELFRAGVGTIPREYADAARSLGASQAVVFWHILLPQGFRAAFPVIATRLIHNMKNTALVAFVAVPDFFHATQTAITRTFRAKEFLFLAAVLYLFLSISLAAFLRWIEGWLGRPSTTVIFRDQSPSLELGEL